jgi:formylglycine-generating enzyme required for sulfatase activity
MLVGLLMVGCGEEAQKEAVQEEEAQELVRVRAEEERRLAAILKHYETKRKRQEELARIEAKRQKPITERVLPLIQKRENFVTDLGLEMLWVKPGKFMMGSPVSEKGRPEPPFTDNETQHQVTLTKGFYLGKYEVTQAQWQRVMGNNPSWSKGADRPVEGVSWNDAVEFCKKLTELERKAGRVPPAWWAYQLPTEAQWEYACRAGTTTAYSWGDSISSSNANYAYDGFGTGLKETTPVGKYPANPWGFHDMHGNVWEMCSDLYGDYPRGAVTDPEGPYIGKSGKWVVPIRRGGSHDNTAMDLRSAKRHGTTPDGGSRLEGFRVGFLPSQ